MKITAQLKAFLLSKGWIIDGASDADIMKAVGQRLLSGELTAAQLGDLTKEGGDAAARARAMIQEEVAKTVGPINATLLLLAAKLGVNVPATVPVVTPPAPGSPPPNPPASPPGGMTAEMQETVTRQVNEHLARIGLSPVGGDGASATGGGMAGLLSRSADILGRPEVRVKAAVEQYAATRKGAIYPARCGLNGRGSEHPFAGRQAIGPGGVLLDHPSDRDKAIAQAWFKWALTKANDPRDIPRQLQLTDHDKDLLHWAVRNSSWSGLLRGEEGDEPGCVKVDRRRLTDWEQKALLDDTVSGGIEIVPVEFDDALITTPVLFGELFPLVTVINVTRGRRMKGATMTNPNFTSGTAEGTAITPINTQSFIGSFDTSIFVAVGAIEMGLDFEEDTPANIGAVLLQKYGEKALEWLDRVIAVGDGVTEPEGVFNSSGVSVVLSDLGAGGHPTIGDYEGLMFGVNKAFRVARGGRNVYIANDVTYRRVRGIPIGPGDERRVFGMTHADYQVMDTPYKVQPNVPNNKIGYFNMAYYRMYRRLGLNVRIETAGAQLALKNTKLIVVRMRYGGRLELGGAGAIIQDAWV